MTKERPIVIKFYNHKEAINTISSKDDKFYKVLFSIKEAVFLLRTIKSNKAYSSSLHSIQYDSNEDVFVVYVTFLRLYSSLDSIVFFNKENSEYGKLLVEKFFEKENEIENRNRKEKGYVIYQESPESLGMLWGNLLKEIIVNNLDYLRTDNCWGYFGANERMFKHDDWINELYSKSSVEEQKRISQFLNTRDARHFMDNIEEETTQEEFIKELIRYMK